MICITDETRLTITDKCSQLIQFIDKIFENYHSTDNPEDWDSKVMDLEEEYIRIKNG